MRTFNLVKSLSTRVNNIVPSLRGLGCSRFREKPTYGKRASLRLLILCLSLAVLGVESVWGLDQYVTVTDFNSSTTYSGENLDGLSEGKTSNHVKFSISGVSYKNVLSVKYLTYGDVSANSSKTSSFTWSTDNNYSVKVTEVSIKLRGYQAKISTKTANAQFSDGTTTGSKIDCQTNSTGNGGTKEVKISNTNGIKSPLTLTMSTGENKAEYTIPEVKYTYQVTHKEYLFGFSANAIKNIDAAGTVSASVENDVVQAAIGVISASTTVTYSVTAVSAGYGFVGWYSDSNYSNLVSTNTTYQQKIDNSTAGSIANQTLYAKFAALPYFYFKAQANKVGTGNVYASFTDGSYSATSDIKTERATTLAQTQSKGTYTAYFKAEETDAAYHFAGWYTDAACTEANRVSTNLSYSEQISGSTATTEASAKTITRYAKFVQELTPEVTANYSGSPKAMFVDDEITSAFSFLNTSTFGSGLSVVSSNDNIITYDIANNKVIAKNEGTATLTFTQTKQEIIKAGEFSFTFNVSKIANTLTADASHSMKVEEQWGSVISGKNSDASVTTTSSDETVAYYDVANNKIVAQNTNNQSFNSKEVTITISQEATYKYTAAEKTITVTVNKHVPTFTWSNATLYHNQIYNDYFTTTGTNALSVKSSSDDGVAYLVDGSNAQKLNLKTLTKAASTTLTVTQAENYYWAEHTESKTITPSVAPNHVPFTYNEAMFNDGNITITKAGTSNIFMVDNGRYVQLGNDATTISGGDAWKEKYIVIKFDGIPEKVSFEYATSSNVSSSPDFKVYESSNGTNFNEIFSDSRNSSSWSSTITKDLSKDTRYLKFFFDGNYGGQYQHIKVTELKAFSTDKSSLDFGSNKKDIACASQTLTFSYANVGHKVTLSTNDSHFTVSPSSITNIGGEKYGSQTITVSYSTAEVHTASNAKLTITDELGNSKEITLSGSTTKKTQTISWVSPYDVEEPAIPIGKTITGAATSSSNLGVTYESSNPSVIEILDGGVAFKAIAEGTATITAKQIGTDDWEQASISKTFKGTNKIIQVISWNQNFTRLLTTYGSQTLTAIVNLEDAQTGAQTYSKERSDLITYTSQNNSVVSVNGATLTIVGVGETTLTATAPGNDLYESATVTIPVKVREPSEGCEDVLLGNNFGSGEYEFFHYSLTDDMEKVVAIDRSTSAIPGQLSFQHKGKKWGLNYSGEIAVYESTNNGSSWTELGAVTPSEGTYNKQTYPLSRNATHVKFFRAKSATGYHYIKDVEIVPAQFIESNVANDEIDFGTVTVNSVEDKSVTLSYANVKDNLAITKSSSDLSLTCEDIIDLDCGATGTNTFTITFNPKAVGNFSDAIQFNDKNSKKNYTLNIKAKVVRSTQHITWEPTQTEYRTIDQIVLNATASSTNQVKYYVKDGTDVADFVNDVLTIKKDGQITIRAYEPGDAIYEAAVDVDKTFNIRKTNLHFDPLPSAATITYPQALSGSALTGGVVKDEDGNVVEGTITWTTPTTQLNAGENQSQGITFTPTTNPAWYNTLSSTTTVSVQKAEPIATPSASDITYGQKVNESVLTNEGTSGTWSWTDTRKNETLPAGTYDDLAVHFTPDNKNYTEADATVSLTVYRATPSLTWTSAPTEADVKAHLTYTATSNHTESEITYSITAGADCATIDASTGVLTITKAGTITVQASQAASDNYEAAVLSQTTILTGEFENRFTGDGGWNNAGNWTNGIPTEENPNVVISGSLTITEPISVGDLTIENIGKVNIVDNGDLTVNGTSDDRETYGNLFVRKGGNITINENANVKVYDFVVESSIGTEGTSISGQVKNSDRVIYTNGAYIDIYMDPEGEMDDTQWYGFTVPFPVDVQNGIARKEGDVFRKCTYGVEYMICEYDMTQRLNSGKGWKYIKSGRLQPGRFYYFTVNGNNNVYSFKAADNTITIHNETQLVVNGEGPNANWNAVGNSTLTYTTISGENVPSFVQTYINGESRYMTVATDDAQFVVGCPFFFQAMQEATMILNEANETIDIHYAPRQESLDKPVCVRIAEEGKHFSDQIYLTASQETTGKYTLGRDLAKAGIGTKSAQLWINAYNQKLSVHEATLMGEQAYYELSIYAPKAGSYELSLPKVPADAAIYLTQNGYPIWNLNESPYVIECYKGTTNEYGLLLRLQEGGSPTDMQTMRSSEKVQKIMKDQRIYINANSQLYDLMGQKVK